LSRVSTYIRLLVFLCLLFCFNSRVYPETWYTLVSGDWDDPDIWTLDPSGALPDNPDSYTPTTSPTSTTDNVVILLGRTVTIQPGNDNKSNAILNVKGRLDFTTTTGHSFTEIKGGGKILLAADNFPSGDSTHFVTGGQGEGTVVYYGGSYNLSSERTFYNLEVDLDDPANTLTLLADYLINGNLTIKSGELQINDNSSTTRLNLTVSGNVLVNDDGAIGVGTADAYSAAAAAGYGNFHKGYHIFTVYGNFTNYGNVRLTNQSVPHYQNRTTSGAVSLVFSGASNNSMQCYDTTDLYIMVVNKGTDQTYELNVFAQDISYFGLFGTNDDAMDATVSDHPENRKALWIRAGTLRLTGELLIPSLTEGGNDWAIGANAKFVLDGENVEVYSTTTTAFDFSGLSYGTPNGIQDGTGDQGTYLYGDFVINDGFYSSGNSSGMCYRDEAAGNLQVNGGEISLTQLRISGFSATGYYSYVQTGGITRIRGNGEIKGSDPIFGLVDPDMTFTMSGGQIIIDENSAAGAIDIECSEGNYDVTGGEVILNYGGNSTVYSTANLYDVEIQDGTDVTLTNDLVVSHDLTINNNTELDADGYDLSVGHDFIFEDGGTYTHGDNTTYFIGSGNSIIDIGNSTTAGVLDFYDLVIEKNQRSNPSLRWTVSIAECTGRTEDPANALNTIIDIQNNLTLTRGNFQIERYTVNLIGDGDLLDGSIITNSANPGRLTLEGPAQQTLNASAAYTSSFGRLEMNNGTNGILLVSDVTIDDLIMTSTAIVDIADYRLSIDSSGISGSGFGITKMIMTDGSAGAKGLRMNIEMSGSYSDNDIIKTFPIGVSTRYSPLDVLADGDFSVTGTVSGTLNITPVNSAHPATSGPNVIPYYWKSAATGFSGFDTEDVNYRANFNGAIPASQRRAFELYDNNWTENGNVTAGGLIEYYHPGFRSEADYTAGQNGEFMQPRVLFSITSGPLNDRDTWSETSHTGAATNQAPRSYDKIIIGGTSTRSDSVYITANNTTVAGVVIRSTKTSDGSIPTLDAGTTTGHTFNSVSGGGKFRISYNGSMPSGDWDGFNKNDTAIFEYFGGTYTLPTTFSVYPNLWLTGTTAVTKTMPNTDLLINNNFEIWGNSVLLSNAASGNLNIGDSLVLKNQGLLQFRATGTARTVNVNGSITFPAYAESDACTVEVENVAATSLTHSLYVSGNIRMGESVLRLWRSATQSVVNLYFYGEQNSEVFDEPSVSAFNIILNRLIINKSVSTADIDFIEQFTLNGATDGNSNEKALYLVKGDLTIDNSLTDITLTSGGGDFAIPSESSLTVREATVRNTGDNTGIYLDGLMVVGDNSQWLLNGGTDNYIRYTSSGNAEIQVNEGTLRVGSQIRRPLNNEMGVLKFSQTSSSSTVIVGENDAPENSRGVFEILNLGSEFNQVADANITIVRQQTSPSVAALYLDPDSYSLSDGSSFTFGNAGTPASQEIGIYSTIPVKNIIVDNSSTNNPSALMWILPLTVENDISINSGAILDANGLDLTVGGDLFNYGTFTANSNTTIFNGTSDQRIVGSTTFYNLTKSTSSTLSLAENNAEIIVANDFAFESGTLRDSSNTVYVQGNCQIDGTHIHSGAGDGIELNGSAEQELTGDGTIGKLTVNNNYGITVAAGNEFTITDTLKMDGGLLDIGNNLLVLGLNTAIEEATPYSATNMIQTNISFTDNGIQKTLPSGGSTFIYPMGSQGKYTPVTLTITANDNSTGKITVKPANEMHPSIVEDSEAPDPEIVDEDNVLQYHWVLKSSGISGFSATAEMKYDPADVEVTAPYDVYDYITARLLSDGSGRWNLFDDVNTFDEINELLIFSFSDVDDSEISGDYTAGVASSAFHGAIPDSVPIYETNSTGNWETATIWTPNVAGGPRGSIVLINSAHTVTATTNFKLVYSTLLEGTLLLNSTFGHRLGIVEGTGTLYLERESLPAGIYDEFFSATGGTLEFGGSTDYDVLGSIYELNNLAFSGTGERRFSDADILLYGNLTINGGATLEVINEYDREIEIRGNLTRTSGTFDAGTGSEASILMSGVINQIITGDFTGSSALNILEINNSNDITLAGDIVIEDQLILTNGAITTSGNTLKVELNADLSPATASGTRYINGALTKELISGNDFNFPVGRNGNPGNIEVSDAGGYAGTGDWSAEYFFTNPTLDGYDVTLFAAPVATVSQTEYWDIQAPAGGEGKLVITLDGSSDVANAATDLDSLLIAAWDGAQWVQVGGDPVVTGTAASGTVTAAADIDFDTYRYFTLALEETVTTATASIISGDATICDGESSDILVVLTGTEPWSVTYTDGVTPTTINGIMASPDTITVSPSSTTTYTLTAASDNNGPATLVGDIDALITVNSAPAITFTNSSTGDEICDGESVVFSAGGGVNYDFHLNDISDQDGASSVYTNSTLLHNDEIYVVVVGSNGCSDTSSTTVMTVNALPVPGISGEDTLCEGGTETYTTEAGMSNYDWEVSAGGTITGGGDGNDFVTVTWDSGIEAQTVSVNYEDVNGCSAASPTELDVWINKLPDTGPGYHIENEFNP
jgi:hypothetical protein